MKSDRIAFFLLFLVISAVGCAPKLDENLLAQKWIMNSYESDEMTKDELDSQGFMFWKLAFEFKPDHQFLQVIESEKTAEGIWQLKGDKLKLEASNPEIQYPEYRVLQLTESSLTLQSTDSRGRIAKVGYTSVRRK